MFMLVSWFGLTLPLLNEIGRAVQQECRDRKSGSAGMPRPISYAVFCLKKKKKIQIQYTAHQPQVTRPLFIYSFHLVCVLPHFLRLIALPIFFFLFFHSATPSLSAISLHDALPICQGLCDY